VRYVRHARCALGCPALAKLSVSVQDQACCGLRKRGTRGGLRSAYGREVGALCAA